MFKLNLNNGSRLGFSNGQSGNFDQIHELNISKKGHACIIICTILIK